MYTHGREIRSSRYTNVPVPRSRIRGEGEKNYIKLYNNISTRVHRDKIHTRKMKCARARVSGLNEGRRITLYTCTRPAGFRGNCGRETQNRSGKRASQTI